MIKHEDLNFGTIISEIRKSANLKQSDLAKKLTFDTSRISRIETGEISISFQEKSALLKAINTDNASNYLSYLEQSWKELDKPPFVHPQREILYQSELKLQELKKLLEEENLSNYLVGEAKMHQQSLLDNVQFIQSTRHSVAYIGDIGVGKTTAVCAQTGLIIKDDKLEKIETVLEVGAGGTTVCEVRIRHGLQYSIFVEPVSDTEVYKFSGELCAGIFEGENSQKENTDIEATKGVSREIDRALRNMSGLTRRYEKNEEGKRKTIDPLKELAKNQDSTEALASEFISRLFLWKRMQREISYDKSTGLSEVEWLRKIFKEINNGKHEKFSLPKRIDIIIPSKPIEISNYEIEIIDTKGIDQTAIRPDTQSCIDEQGTLIVLCSKFNDAPGTSVQTLLEHLKKTEQINVLNERTAILVLPYEKEALAVKDDSGDSVQDVKEGYEVKEEQIEMLLGKIGLDKIPTHFFDSFNDKPIKLNEFIEEQINNLRNERIKRIQSISDAVDYLISNKEQESVRLSQEEVAKKIRIFLEQSPKLTEYNRNITIYLFAWMNSTHPRTLWASMRRNGHWGNFNVYFNLGNGTRQEVSKDSSKIFLELDGILKNLLGDEGLDPSHQFLEELRLNWKTWNSNFLNRVQIIGNQMFMPFLDKSSLWNECANLYGWGSGFRDDVAKKLRGWFHDDEQKPLFGILNERIQTAWKEEVLNQLENLINKD